MATNPQSEEIFDKNTALHYRPVTIHGVNPLLILPWIGVLIGWSHLMTWSVTIPLITYTFLHSWLVKKGLSVKGMLLRFWLKLNKNSANNCPRL